MYSKLYSLYYTIFQLNKFFSASNNLLPTGYHSNIQKAKECIKCIGYWRPDVHRSSPQVLCPASLSLPRMGKPDLPTIRQEGRHRGMVAPASHPRQRQHNTLSVLSFSSHLVKLGEAVWRLDVRECSTGQTRRHFWLAVVTLQEETAVAAWLCCHRC